MMRRSRSYPTNECSVFRSCGRESRSKLVASSINDGAKKMKSFHSLARLPRSLVAGAVVSVIAVAPAFAAPSLTLSSLPFDITTIPPRDFLLFGSIALLVIALTAKVLRDRHDREPPPRGPDLRWWKN